MTRGHMAYCILQNGVNSRSLGPGRRPRPQEGGRSWNSSETPSVWGAGTRPKNIDIKVLLDEAGSPTGLHHQSHARSRAALKKGLLYSEFERLRKRLNVPASLLAHTTNIVPRTLSRRKQEGRLRTDESERVFRIGVLSSTPRHDDLSVTRAVRENGLHHPQDCPRWARARALEGERGQPNPGAPEEGRGILLWPHRARRVLHGASPPGGLSRPATQTRLLMEREPSGFPGRWKPSRDSDGIYIRVAIAGRV